MEYFDRARDKILMGAERRSMVMSEQEKKLTAYHEAGHALVAKLTPDANPQEAFFVRCDRTTMTTNDLDNGRMICLVGVAPVEPVEYILIEVALSADRGVSVRGAG